MSAIWIDINSDLGESEESLANGTDFELMRYITSANVACGGHAGDEHTMRETVRIARQLNVAVGAHPGYPDRDNFGRLESPMSAAEIEATVRDQIAALAEVAEPLGVSLVHCKPHGALYHAANKSAEIAAAIGRAVLESDEQLIMVGQAGSSTLTLWGSDGTDPAPPRPSPTVPTNPTVFCAAVPWQEHCLTIRSRQHGRRLTSRRDTSLSPPTDRSLKVAADTICIHSDTPGSVAIARAVTTRLKQGGVQCSRYPRS